MNEEWFLLASPPLLIFKPVFLGCATFHKWMCYKGTKDLGNTNLAWAEYYNPEVQYKILWWNGLNLISSPSQMVSISWSHNPNLLESPTHKMKLKKDNEHQNFYMDEPQKRGCKKITRSGPVKIFHYMCFELQSHNLTDNKIIKLYFRNQGNGSSEIRLQYLCNSDWTITVAGNDWWCL